LFDVDGNFTIATMAILMSVLIMKDTRNPENESMYSTTRAGTMSAIRKSMPFDYRESCNTDT